jgi:alpha-D-ribose 1-methylphosphonate 5-triphosphate synthase subunit PhnH
MPAAAFPAPVLASQAAFRALMDAVARPGTIKPLPPAATAPSPLSATAAAVALTVLDYETPVWLDAPLARSPQVADWIRLHAGARVTSDPRQAAFAFIADPVQAPAFDGFSLGTPEYPDRSATLVLQVEGFGSGQRLLLAGPGIANVQSFAAQPLPPDFQSRIAANRALFPRGVDVILVSPDAVAALPRSVAATRG